MDIKMKKGMIYRAADTEIQLEEENFAAREPVSKELSFEIEQDYEACEFVVTTESTGNFEVVLYRETDDEQWEQSISDGNSCTINVRDVKSGRWIVRVVLAKSEEAIELEEELSPEKLIGKVKINVRAIDKTVFSLGNVEVARDIAGLTEYLKDDAIVVEWSDSSCGNVNISVIDTKTSQILDRQTVNGRYYEFQLPPLTEEITVDIVPAESQGISGAASQRTIKVENIPEATVLYEDRAYTNQDSVPVSIALEKPYSLLFMNNNAEVKRTGILSEGTYSFDIPVNEGENDILTYVVDSEHNMRSTAYSIIRDSVKPTLTLDREYDGMTTDEDAITITGTISDYESFTVNEVEPVVAGDGSFKAEYILKDGENILNVRAVDIAENETLYQAVIVKEVKKSPSPLLLILPIFFIGTASLIFFFKSNIWKMNWQKIFRKVRENDKEQRKLQIKEWKKTVAGMMLAGIFFFVLLTKVVLWGVVPSESMEPFLNTGDYVIVNGLAYMKHKPQRGDVIVFTSHDKSSDGQLLIKRVIGIPGDSLSFEDGYLYIDGEPVYEEYLREDSETNCAGEFEVREGCYFVMGDNRENSVDSRFWEEPYINESEIKGKLITAIPVKEIKKAITSVFR